MDTKEILFYAATALIIGCLYIIIPWIHGKIIKHFGKNDWTEL